MTILLRNMHLALGVRLREYQSVREIPSRNIERPEGGRMGVYQFHFPAICFRNSTLQSSNPIPIFDFWHFFPFPVTKSQSQWLEPHFTRAKPGQSQFPFYPLRPWGELSKNTVADSPSARRKLGWKNSRKIEKMKKKTIVSLKAEKYMWNYRPFLSNTNINFFRVFFVCCHRSV